VSFLIVLLLAILWILLFDFAIEEAFPNLFPIADYGLSLLILFIGFLLPLSTNTVGQRYNRYPETMIDVMANARALSTAVHIMRERGGVITEEAKLKQLHTIIRALPTAVRDQFQDRGEKYGESYGGFIIPDADLAKRLERYTFSHQGAPQLYSDSLLTLLYHATIGIDTGDFGTRVEQMRRSIAEVEKVKRTGVMPAVMGFMLVVVWLFALSAPWLLWGYYRWWGVLFMFVTVWPALAAIEIGRSLANPFVRSSKTWHDIDDAILDTIKFIDKELLDLQTANMRLPYFH
jgi:predicted membrane chloride channel (bestrophin family)